LRKIGIDLDNTLIRSINREVDIAAKNLGIKKYPDICDYWFSNLTKEHRNECMRLFHDPNFMGYKNQIPIENNYYKLIKWQELGYNILIMTAREKSVHKVTLDLVKLYFPLIKKVLFCDIKESKEQLMLNEGLDIWIDDAPHGIETSCKLGIRTYLIYNERTKKYIPEDIPKRLPVICVEKISDIILEGERMDD
jgi:hypothetical protein